MTEAMKRLLDCMPKPPKFEYDWPGLAALAPLKGPFEAMANTAQHPAWHGEGDVWVHTRMVCDALAGLADFRALPGDERQALALAALLHDIGKPRTTRMEDGKLVAPRHGPVGALMARSLLWRDFGLCGDPAAMRLREAVCLLVKYHTKPNHFIDGEFQETGILRLASSGELAPLFTVRALCLLAEADRLGSIADDNPEQLEKVALGRELAAEAGCLDGPYPFASARTQRALFSGGSVWKDQALYDDSWGEVILMCGLPGTGKDTWLRENCPDLPTVCLDDIRRELGVGPGDNQGPVVQAARERAREYLRKKQPFAWNATSLTGLRAQQVELFESYHARARIVYLETDLDENLRRNASRAAAVPEDVIGDMLEKLEPPERFEAQSVEWRGI